MPRPMTISAALAFLCLACATPQPQPVDARAVEGVVRPFTEALQGRRLDAVSGMFEPGARWVEQSYPVSIDSMLSVFRGMESMGVRLEYDLRDFVVAGEGTVAWATWSNHGTFVVASEPGKTAFLALKSTGWPGTIDSTASEWRISATFSESAVLRRQKGTWRIVFGHTTPLPPGA